MILPTKVSLSGRVKDAGAKDMLKKQLQGLGNNMDDFLCLKTGAIKSKKMKKQKTAEEEAQQEMKKLEKKSPVLSFKIDMYSESDGVFS